MYDAAVQLHPPHLRLQDRTLLRWLPSAALCLLAACTTDPKSSTPDSPPQSDTATECTGTESECNGRDDDCDGVVDEPLEPPTPTWFPDADGDGYGDAFEPTVGCSAPAGHVSDGQDCDDTLGDIHPGAFDVVGDGVDQDCDGIDATCDPTVGATRPFTGAVELRGSAATTQAADLCAEYDGIDGTLTIVESAWTDLSALRCVCAVTGGVFVSDNPSLAVLDGLPEGRRLGRVVELTANPSLTGTGGLRGTTWVDGGLSDTRLVVEDAPSLTALDGFDGLDHIDLVQLRGLSSLEVFDGLPDLERVHESLEIRDNALLQAISGLSRLSSTDELRIEDNPLLHDLSGLEALQSVRYLTLGGNQLSSLADFGTLRAIDARLTLRDAPALTSTSGLIQLERLGGLRITGNPVLAGLEGFGDAAAAGGISGSVELSANPELHDLRGLDWVTWIGGDLYLGEASEPTPLESLAGLEQLEVVVGAVVVQRVLLLDDLEGLDSLREVGALRIDGSNQPPGDVFSLVGAPALTTVHQTLDIRNHATLLSLSGLETVQTVGDVLLLDNPALRSLDGLQGLEVADDLIALRNPRLADVSALYGLQQVDDVCLEVPANASEPDALLAFLGVEETCP